MGKFATPSVTQLQARGLWVAAVCPCGHQGMVPIEVLVRLAGAETILYSFVLDEIAERCRCLACGVKGPKLSIVAQQ